LYTVKTGSTSNAYNRLRTIGFLTIPSINFVFVFFSVFLESAGTIVIKKNKIKVKRIMEMAIKSFRLTLSHVRYTEAD